MLSNRDLNWELQSLPQKEHEVGLRVACHQQAVAVRDRHKQDGGEAFAIEIRHSLKSDHRVTFDNRAQAGEHLEKLRRQVESLASVEAYHFGSYRGFEIFAQRQLSRVEGLFDPVEGFLRLPGGQFRYAFSFSDSAEITTPAPGLPAPAVNVERPAASADSDAQSSPPPMIAEDQPNTQRQVTLDDLRRQQDQKPKRRSSSATPVEQMTLW